jgi:hypothetical protein
MLQDVRYALRALSKKRAISHRVELRGSIQ